MQSYTQTNSLVTLEHGPSKEWSGVHRLHNNASSHKCEVFKSFLASEKVKVLNHPPYLPDLSPCDFFLFRRLKKTLLEISIRLEVLLAALFNSASNRYQKKTIYLLFALGLLLCGFLTLPGTRDT